MDNEYLADLADLIVLFISVGAIVAAGMGVL